MSTAALPGACPSYVHRRYAVFVSISKQQHPCFSGLVQLTLSVMLSHGG
jgi:hypothetical protein